MAPPGFNGLAHTSAELVTCNSKTPSGRLPHVLKPFPARSYLPELANPQREPDLLVLLAAALVALLRVSSTDKACVRTAMG